MNQTVNFTPLHCNKCGHQWFPIRGKLPAVCPRCKSYRWNEQENAGGEVVVSGSPI